MLPFKLDDAGTTLRPMDEAALDARDDAAMRRAKLTFGTGVGDSPDDWYILYLNDDDTLAAAAYTVTYGKTVAEAEADPHAIVYNNVVDVPDADGEADGRARQHRVDVSQLVHRPAASTRSRSDRRR